MPFSKNCKRLTLHPYALSIEYWISSGFIKGFKTNFPSKFDQIYKLKYEFDGFVKSSILPARYLDLWMPLSKPVWKWFVWIRCVGWLKIDRMFKSSYTNNALNWESNKLGSRILMLILPSVYPTAVAPLRVARFSNTMLSDGPTLAVVERNPRNGFPSGINSEDRF